MLTAAEFTIPGDEPLSDALQALAAEGAFVFVRGEEPLARLTFDGGAQGKTLDLRPECPIVINY